MPARAPAVTYPTGRSARLAAVLLGLLLAPVAPCIYMLFGAIGKAGQAKAAVILMCALALAGVALWWFWRQQVPRHLVWDGQFWWLSESRGADGRTVRGRVELQLDMQRSALVRFVTADAGPGVWLWVDQGAAPRLWHPLRCALYSSALPHDPKGSGDTAERA